MLSRYALILLLFFAAVLGPALLKTDRSPASPRPELDDVPAEALEALRQGRYWRASRILQGHLDTIPDPKPQTILLAAQAGAGWGDWATVERLLGGQIWLDSLGGGIGWNLLGQSQLALGQWDASDQSLKRYLALAPEDAAQERGLAEARRGFALTRSGNGAEAIRAFERAAALLPGIGDWMQYFAAEAAAAIGDTAAVRQKLDAAEPMLAREWGWRLRVNARTNAGDLAGASVAAEGAANALQSASRRAEAWLVLGDLRLLAGNEAGAKDAFRRAMTAAPASAAGIDAARKLSSLPGLTAQDHLRIGRLYLRHGNFDRGIAGLVAFLNSGQGSALERGEIQLEIARAYFNRGRYAEAERRLLALAESAPSARIGAEAMYLAGRAQYRQGRGAEGQRTFIRTAERFPDQAAAAQATFLVADLAHDDGELDRAREYYRRTASIRPNINEAGLALMRLGGIAYAEGDFEEAAAIFEEYRRHHPDGRRYQQATYWAAKSYQRLGKMDLARARLQEVPKTDPISWYGLRAVEQLGGSFASVPLEPSPEPNPAAEAEVRNALVRLDLLRALGREEAAEFEVERLKEHFLRTDGAIYALAEAFNERGYTFTGIRLGWEIHKREGAWNPRLLRIIYPFPYRELIMAEARERGLDPYLVAGLIRQESMFTSDIKSPAGAIGLMQIMPNTGRALARNVGISNFALGLLEQPEINVHLGVAYMADLLDQYRGRLASVLAAYNAGPHRVSRWSRFPEYGDEELFTERIPFAETRNYVKIVQQNARLYRALYAEDDATRTPGAPATPRATPAPAGD